MSGEDGSILIFQVLLLSIIKVTVLLEDCSEPDASVTFAVARLLVVVAGLWVQALTLPPACEV